MLNASFKSALLTTRLCKYLDTQELDFLMQNNEIISFSTGELILKQGKKGVGLYIILEGKALVTARVLGEGHINLAALDVGNFIGEISLIEDAPCVASVIAATRVNCLLITKEYFNMLSLLYPQTKYKLSRSIADEIFLRIQDVYLKITKHMKQANMVTRSVFSEVIHSFSHPSIISYEESGIDYKYLKRGELFKDFDNADLHKLLENAEFLKASKYSTLVHENEPNDNCYIVLRGAVQSNIVQDNKIAKLSVLGPLNFFTSTSTIDSSLPSIINYTACEPSILLKLSGTKLHKLQSKNVYLYYKVFDLICKSYAHLENAIDKLNVRLNSEFYNR